MKNFVFLIMMLMSQLSFAGSQLTYAEAKVPQFSYDIVDEGLGLVFIENGRKTKVKPKYTISDAQKLTIVSAPADKLKENVEMLLVVLAQGAFMQTVQIFIPGQVDQVIESSQTMPTCTFESYGDFSWDAPTDLKDRVQLVSGGGKSELRIKVGKLRNKADINSIEPHWVKCFSF
jgi:hypothetical protein